MGGISRVEEKNGTTVLFLMTKYNGEKKAKYAAFLFYERNDVMAPESVSTAPQPPIKLSALSLSKYPRGYCCKCLSMRLQLLNFRNTQKLSLRGDRWVRSNQL